MKRSRIGIKRKKRKVNIAIALFFLVILPILAVGIGSRITEWLVIPTINTDDILKSPGNITLEDLEDKEAIENLENEDLKTEEENLEPTEKEEVYTESIDLNPLSFYMIQVASISDNKNIEVLAEELKSNNFPHIIYKADNTYKIYTYGSTKRENIDEKLAKVREVYFDAYVGQVHIPKNQINYSEENKNTAEIVENINSLVSLFDEYSDALYKSDSEEKALSKYKEILTKHQNLLTNMSENIKNATLPNEFPTVAHINKMIDRQEKNISESLKILEEEPNTYELQNYFLDSVFRIIEIIKR